MNKFIGQACLAGGTVILLGTAAAHAQVIDPLTGSLSGYTTTLVLDNSHGVSSVSFTDSASGLQANFVGSLADPEQALFLAPVSSFSTTFVPGTMLTVKTTVPVTTAQLDLGLAVSSTVAPPAANSGNSFNSRTTFDFASISVRSQQGSVRGGEDISGVLNTGFNTAAVSSTVQNLFIEWISTDVFTLGYTDTSSAQHTLYTATFAPGSTIGTAIGFYADMRDAGGTTLGNLTDLSVQPIPEPGTIGIMGLGGLLATIYARRRK